MNADCGVAPGKTQFLICLPSKEQRYTPPEDVLGANRCAPSRDTDKLETPPLNTTPVATHPWREPPKKLTSHATTVCRATPVDTTMYASDPLIRMPERVTALLFDVGDGGRANAVRFETANMHEAASITPEVEFVLHETTLPCLAAVVRKT